MNVIKNPFILDTHSGQGAHRKKTTIIQFQIPFAPKGEAIILFLNQLVQGRPV